MKISEAAASSGCHLETIRYYERVGLMPKPRRTASGYREYRDDEVDRLRFITRSRDLGFSLLQEHWRVVFGPLLILLVLFARRGVYGSIAAAMRRTS